MKFTEIIKKNRELNEQLTGEKYKIKVLSNITINQIKEILEFTLRDNEINAEVEIGNYDSIIQDSNDLSKYNAVLVFWELSNLIEDLHIKCNLMNKSFIDDFKNQIEAEVTLLLKNLNKIPLVLINQFSSMAFDVDPLAQSKLNKMCAHFNAVLKNNISSNIKLVDIDMIFAKVGLSESIDYRQFQSAKALYTNKFYIEYANAIAVSFLSVTGRIKKLLILDCDNTLWNGILGEDGRDGIQMNKDSLMGKPFYDVQNIIKTYHDKGLLLALCSKNNLNDVEEILINHPDMILKHENFVIKKVNWEYKEKNIKCISQELNIGLDSFIFVDDSDFEIEQIKNELPQVKCIKVPNNISEYPVHMLHALKVFDHSLSTKEDKNKTEMYRHENIRKLQSNKFDSIDDYLASLNLKVRLLWNEHIPISRASQLTQKTNQFNLTTRRYTEIDIERMLNDKFYTLSAFSVVDRFGEYGVAGLIIIKLDENIKGLALIDSFLMSCRTIGRNVEYAVFSQVIDKLKNLDIKFLHAEYFATQKNKLVKNFYDNLGFDEVYSEKRCKRYKIFIDDFNSTNIKYIETINIG